MKTLSFGSGLGRSIVVAAFILMALSSREVGAAEESAWAFLGFSDDGGFVAVEIFGVHEDSGAPYSIIRIIDTKANQFVVPPITTCVGQGCDDTKLAKPTQKEVRTINREKAKEALARFRIDINLQGQRTKLSWKQRAHGDPGSGAVGMARETAQFRWLNADWTLVLQEVPAPNGRDTGNGPPRMIDLRLQKYGSELILQKDKSIPKSRGTGIYWYELDTMITYNNSVLVVLRYARPGDEGPDVSQLFVTGAGF
jgi:predicted secreted protein